MLAVAVLPAVLAQSVCQTGWTQAPPNSDWGDKCYREFGPTATRGSISLSVGYNHFACQAACKNESATARMLCLMSGAETSFVTKQAHMKGWVAFTQDSSRSDYVEPAGGWGWECGSTYVPAWAPQEDDADSQEPNDWGGGGGDSGVGASCAALRRDGFMEDMTCQEGDATAPNSALLVPLSRCYTHVLTTHPLLRSGLHL